MHYTRMREKKYNVHGNKQKLVQYTRKKEKCTVHIKKEEENSMKIVYTKRSLYSKQQKGEEFRHYNKKKRDLYKTHQNEK